MEREKFIKTLNPLKFLIIFYTVGIIGHSVPVLLPFMLMITPLALLVSGSVVIISLAQNGYKTELKFLTGVAIMTFTAECIGVNTGYIFGEYQYGDVLGIKICGVPLIIAFNWMLVIAGSFALAQHITTNIIAFPIIGAIIPVLFDFQLEPVAIHLGYWQWYTNNVPITNYISWGGLSLLASLFFIGLKRTIKHKLTIYYLLIQVIYFIVLRILISIQII